MTHHVSFSKCISTILTLILFVGIANVHAVEVERTTLSSTTLPVNIDNLDNAQIELNKQHLQGPRRDDPYVEGKFLLLRGLNPWWGDVEGIFSAAELDYDRINDPSELENLDLCDYDVIWIGDVETDDWNTEYNNYRNYIDEWVANGGALYHCTGTNSEGVKPIHPGGLTYLDQYYFSHGYTVPPQDECLLFDLLDWDPNTYLYGGFLGWTRYAENEIADISGDYQILITEDMDGEGEVLVARYGYGDGQVIVTGTFDGDFAPFVTYWGEVNPEIFAYLMSLSNVICEDNNREQLLLDLIDHIDGLVDAGELNSNQASFLLRSLHNAWNALQNGQTNYVIQYLNDFCRRAAMMAWWRVLSIEEVQYMCDIVHQVLVSLGEGDGVASLTDLIAAIDETLPEIFNLNEAYPNPFNSSTTISFTLPFEMNASLTIYDVSGRSVATLVEGVQQAGAHSEIFNAGNLTSGMYFVVLNAGGKVLTQKVMFVQ